MINLAFTLISAILGVAMFGAILLAEAKPQGKASSVSGGGAAADAWSSSSVVLRDDAFDKLAIDDIRTGGKALADTRPDGGMRSKPQRPTSDDQRRTQVASASGRSFAPAQMAAQVPGFGVTYRQM